MPYGYQKRNIYGDPMEGKTFPGYPYGQARVVSEPVLGYDYTYSYRSGKQSKSLLLESQHDSAVIQSDLRDALYNRRVQLEKAVNEIVEPAVGSSSIFSSTDVGHSFASFKVRIEQPYGWQKLSQSGVPWQVQPAIFGMSDLPIPTFADPLGLAYGEGGFWNRFTYYNWPASIYGNVSAPLAQQVVSQTFHKSLATGIISSANPWKPQASLAVTVMELLTGDVPTVLKGLRNHLSALERLKSGERKRPLDGSREIDPGGNWLNLQFGWVPLVSDILAAVRVLFQLHMLLYGSASRRRKRQGEIGTWSRHNETVPSERGLRTSTILGPNRVLSSSGSLGGNTPIFTSGDWARDFKVTADWRFTARFHQGAVPNATENGYLDRATHLLGLELTPDVLWQLTPWTWLLDWASNLGAVSSNLSSLAWSNVLLDYAYLTYKVKTVSSTSFMSSGSYNYGSGFLIEIPPVLFNRATTVETIREQASPYGFSVGWDGLSPFQLSILAALGMSRGR